jgi:hypothetical protein
MGKLMTSKEIPKMQGWDSATVLLEALYFGNDSHLGAPKALRITCIGFEF